MKYYGDIEIDDACLYALLKDNVSAEILVNIKQITDAETFDQESARYVLLNKEEIPDGILLFYYCQGDWLK